MNSVVARRAARGAPAAALAAALLLTGCSSSDDDSDGEQQIDALFETDQTDRDVLPDEALEYLAVDGTTSRYLGADGGTTFYAARPSEEAGVCLVLVDVEEEGWSGCSEAVGGAGITVSNGQDRAMLLTPDADLSSLGGPGWTRVSDFLAVL